MTDIINPENRPIKQQREEAIKKLELKFAHGYLEVEEIKTRLDLFSGIHVLNAVYYKKAGRQQVDCSPMQPSLVGTSSLLGHATLGD